MRRRKRLLGMSVAAALLLAATVGSGRAAGAVSFEAVPGQSVVSVPGTGRVTYTLKMTTNAEGTERFAVRASSPRFGDPDLAHGTSLGTGAIPAISGAGVFAGGYSSIPGVAGCSQIGRGSHGLIDGVTTMFVVLPPSSQTSLEYSFAVAPEAPWAATRYDPSFHILREAPSGSDPTIDVDLLIQTFEPAVTGLSGVEIRFKTKPRSPELPVTLNNPPAEIRKGREIAIRGGTIPKLRRQKLRLMYAGPDDKKPKLLAKVRTSRKGKFRYKGWEPDEKGPYELWVEYRSQRDHLASDFTCSRMFELVPGKK